jgi:hypothetical protein
MGAGCSLSKRGSGSSGLQSVILPSPRPIARIAEAPAAELKDTDVTCELPRGAVSESGILCCIVVRSSDHRYT